MDIHDETRLVARVVARDGDALEELIRRHKRRIVGGLRRQPGLNADETEEVFQRFLIHIWEDDFSRLRAWRHEASLGIYFLRMSRNLALDYRRSCPLCHYLPMPDSPAPLSIEDRLALDEVRSRLSVRDNELIRRRYDLGESYREIAVALDMSVNSVGVALLRAQRRLRALWEGPL